MSALTGSPALPSSPARFPVNLVVHTSGCIGSPRVSGSTSLRSASTSPGSRSVADGRPAPAWRTRPPGSMPCSSSRAPRDTVSGCNLVKAATRLIPPRPSARACAPSVSRHCRSSRCGFSSASMAAKRSSSTSTVAIPHTIGIRLGQTRVIQRRALRSSRRSAPGREQDTLAEQRQACASEHLALDHLQWLTRPSTGPELQGMVRPLVTASRSGFSPLANDEMPGSPASLASAIHWGRSWPVSLMSMPANARTWSDAVAARGSGPGWP